MYFPQKWVFWLESFNNKDNIERGSKQKRFMCGNELWIIELVTSWRQINDKIKKVVIKTIIAGTNND